MKNRRLIISLLLICCMLTACSTIQEEKLPETTVQVESAVTDHAEVTETIAEETVGGEDYIFLDNVYETLADYELWMKSSKLPPNFISYHDVEGFGSFEFFKIHSDEAWYSYWMLSGGKRIAIMISYQPYRNLDKQTYIDSKGEDLRVCSEMGWTYQRVGDAIYKYYDGTLRDIYLLDGNNEIWVQYDNINEYKPNDTLLGKLLNRSTAEQTAKELCEAFRDTSN